MKSSRRLLHELRASTCRKSDGGECERATQSSGCSALAGQHNTNTLLHGAVGRLASRELSNDVPYWTGDGATALSEGDTVEAPLGVQGASPLLWRLSSRMCTPPWRLRCSAAAHAHPARQLAGLHSLAGVVAQPSVLVVPHALSLRPWTWTRGKALLQA